MDYDVLSDIKEALEAGDAALAGRLRAMRPADLADVVERLDAEERREVFRLLPDAAAGEVLSELDEAVAAEIVADLAPERASRLLGGIPSDDAADVLQDLPDAAADALLAGMAAEDAREVRGLLEYPEHSAGGRMVTRFATVSETDTVAQVIAGLRAHPPEAENAYYLYARDPQGRLTGVVSLRDLIVAEPEARVGDIMTRDVISVRADADQEEAAGLVARYDLLALPVVDEERRLVGIITVDDILEVLEEEATEDILALSSGTEPPPERVAPSLQRRLPRVAGAIAAGLAAAVLVGAGREAFQVRVPFLLFVPLVLAVSDVVTAQVMAAVEGAFRRELPAGGVVRAAGRELLITALLAGAAGLALAVLLGHWRGLGAVGSTLGAAVFLVAAAAAAVGALLPALAHVFRRDASAVSVSAATVLANVAGLAVYLWAVAGVR